MLNSVRAEGDGDGTEPADVDGAGGAPFFHGAGPAVQVVPWRRQVVGTLG